MTDELKILPEKVIKTEMPDFTSVDNMFNQYKVFKAVGCQRCENTGYASRVSISEVIEINEALKDMINNGDENLSIEAVRKTEDFISIKQDGIIKVFQGFTTMEEVLRVIES